MAASLATKLQVKPAARVRLINASKEAKALATHELPEQKVVTAGAGEAVLLFVDSLAETSELAPGAIKAAGDGLLWIAYPKGTAKTATDVNRDRLSAALASLGWQSVRLVAVDATWSAMRFRRTEDVGT